MARVRLTFRQRDVTAAIKAVERSGHTAYRVQIGRDGSIILELTPTATNEPASDPSNPVDEWLAKHAHNIKGSQSG